MLHMELKHGNSSKIWIKTYVDGNLFFSRNRCNAQNFKKIYKLCYKLKINSKNSMLDYIGYHVRRMNEEEYLKKFRNSGQLEEERE